MEEVDKIIIDSLKNLNCDIEENITSLKGFSPDTVVSAIVCCLESINVGLTLPKRMPGSMSLRLKLATQLVEHIQDVGFKGDLGYQTILYSNEVELRRVLMFLIERLPRENNKIAATDAIGYVPSLVKEIEEKMRLSLQKAWVPTHILQNGGRICGDSFLRQSFGASYPLRTDNIEIPANSNITEDLKQYWVHNVPLVTKQCTAHTLIPSLLFKDNQYTVKEFKLNELASNIDPIDSLVMNVNEVSFQSIDATHKTEDLDCTENKIINLMKNIEAKKEQYKNLQEEFKSVEAKYAQLLSIQSMEEAELKDVISKHNIKSKTLTVLSKEENMSKLKTLVENGNERLLDLANQWNEVQSPLLEQYKTLQSSLSEQELKLNEEKDKLMSVRNKVNQLQQDIVEKEVLEKRLVQECQNINKNNNRSSYTKRILEIIANIRKQDGEIGKILKDTKAVQKEINQLTGQLDRSFMLSDALIFKDAKHDEVARRAYKLLATLHFDCESIIQSVTDLGAIERESRNLQDQIDAELDKDMASKLQRVNSDIEELRKELMKDENHSKMIN